MTDGMNAMYNAIPPIVGGLLTLEIIDRLMPEDREACERCQRRMKEVV